MDPKKQKRLGAAPIASFEKSLEDATSNNTGVTMPISLGAIAATLNQSSMYQQAASNINAKHDINSNSNINVKMDAKITNSSVAVEATQKENCAASRLEDVPVAAAANKQFSDGKRAPTLKAVASDANNQQLYKGFSTLAIPQTPRIELSRASSSSTKEEDSRESSPENVFEQVGTGTLQETIVLGFREEGALELRSSTEELYFMDAAQKKEEQAKLQQQQQQQQQQLQQQQQQAKRSSPHIFKYEDHQIYLQQHQRKDSASSEVAALLCISGRTSRISSVGSQGSAVSRLSAVSGVSRSPSPHRMLLETSFCGPKPVENVADSRMPSSVEPHTVELLEQMLLRRKHDPTQAVLAEGIKIQGSPKKLNSNINTLSNGDTKAIKTTEGKTRTTATIGAQRTSTKSPGQMVVGKTASGTEYIRINLKPDHMYADKGIAPNERVVEAPNTLTPVYATSQKKPGTLSLGRNMLNENLLTPTASPKATRHAAATAKEQISRSPSPAAQSVSRKSSFSSLFRFGAGGKDSPDSPRERSRSRSKSKDRTATQSQNVTPSKQKSVLAIFKPSGKRGSNTGVEIKTSSKSSSPIDGIEPHLRSKSQTPVPGSASTSRPGSRLRYYDEPVEGVIHIPLHTPTEERETRKLLQGIQQLIEEPVRPIPAPITASQLAAAAAALKPVGARKNSGNGNGNGNAAKSVASTRVTQNEKRKPLENIDAIQTLSQEEDTKLRNWSLEAQRHSSQDSQDTVISESSYSNAIRLGLRTAKHLPDVKEQDAMQENGLTAEAEALIHRLPSLDSNTSVCETKIIETVATVNTTSAELASAQNVKEDAISAKEKRRLLFATRLGSGSQEQVFSTQFSISKTESLSSQLSEKGQDTIIESPESEGLQRQSTVIRRSEEETESFAQTRITTKFIGTAGGTIKRQGSTDMRALRQRSFSTSEDERGTTVTKTTTTAVVLRRKESSDEPHRKSRSTSEEDAVDAANQRHSRYLENFDVRKKYHENVLPRKPKRQATSETNTSKEIDPFSVQTNTKFERKPTIPQPPPPSTAPTPSPPASNVNSTVGSRTPTPTKATAAMRSQSQSPVERSRQTPTKPPRNITPTRRSQVNTPTSPSPVPSHTTPTHGMRYESPLTDRQSKTASTDEPIESSESERDSTGITALEHKRRHTHSHVAAIEDNESTGLVSQESFDDELPYIPTTLPEERAQGVSLIPMKERANMELRTCPVERPRSTTPLNPSHLEEFGGMHTPQESPLELYGSVPVRGEKLRISLPRKDPTKEKVQSQRSPRRSSNTSGKSWFEFAGEGLRATTTANLERKDSSKQLLDNVKDKKPNSAAAVSKTAVVAQKAVASGKSTQRKLSGHWIDFENIPEKRKPPKRITALPKESTASIGKSPQNKKLQTQPDLTSATAHADGKLHYNYVKPEDCQCECHELGRGPEHASNAEMCLAAATEKVANVDLLHQGEDMLPLLDTEGQEGIDRSHLSDSSREFSYYTDDECDIPERRRISTRRSHSSTKGEFPRRDYAHSPRNRKFPDNRN